jgi:hypothetical protein
MPGTLITNLPTAASVADTDKVLVFNGNDGAMGAAISTMFNGKTLTKTQLLPSVVSELNTPVQLLDNPDNYPFHIIGISPSSNVVGPGNHQALCIAVNGATISAVTMESPSVYIAIFATIAVNNGTGTITMTKANKSGWANAKITGLWGVK